MTQGFRGAWDLKGASADVLRQAGVGLGMAAEHVLGVSNTMVPFEEGDLADSGTSSQDELTAAVSYRDTAYDGQAAQQHEDMTLNHDQGRQAKFLETAMLRERAAIGQIIARQARKAT